MVVELLRLRLELKLNPKMKLSLIKKKRNKKVNDALKRR